MTICFVGTQDNLSKNCSELQIQEIEWNPLAGAFALSRHRQLHGDRSVGIVLIRLKYNLGLRLWYSYLIFMAQTSKIRVWSWTWAAILTKMQSGTVQLPWSAAKSVSFASSEACRWNVISLLKDCWQEYKNHQPGKTTSMVYLGQGAYKEGREYAQSA